MAAYFLDTSTVVKRYVHETGTAWVQALTDPAAGHFLYVARITDVEMIAAVARRRRLGSLSPAQSGHAINAFRQDLAQQYRIVELTIPILQQASQLADRHVLRAYDAVQLATTSWAQNWHYTSTGGSKSFVRFYRFHHFIAVGALHIDAGLTPDVQFARWPGIPCLARRLPLPRFLVAGTIGIKPRRVLLEESLSLSLKPAIGLDRVPRSRLTRRSSWVPGTPYLCAVQRC